jgi:hypothetical protein
MVRITLLLFDIDNYYFIHVVCVLIDLKFLCPRCFIIFRVNDFVIRVTSRTFIVREACVNNIILVCAY